MIYLHSNNESPIITQTNGIYLYIYYLKTTTCDGSQIAGQRQLATNFEIMTILK